MAGTTATMGKYTNIYRLPRTHIAAAIIGTALLFLVPFEMGEYARFVILLVAINVIVTTGVNIAMGYCGLVSVGHAGFVAIGAYVAGLVITQWHADALVAIAMGSLAAGVAGIVIGLPALRLNPLYIAMVTFGFGQAVNYIALNWIEVTGGPNGMAVPPPALLGMPLSSTSTYVLTIVFCLISLWVARNIGLMRLGRAFIAIRESEIAAQSMGVSVARYKTIAFGISAVYGGLAGALYALVAEYVNPDAFGFLVSVLYVTMSVVGGLGTFLGPIIGAGLLTLLPELLRPLAEYKEVISGLVLLFCLVLMPQGLVPLVQGWIASLRGKTRKAEKAT